MSLSRRDFVKTPLVVAGASAIGVGTVATARAGTGSREAAETIELWPRPPAGALNPGMAELVEQSSSNPDYSSRRMKGISRPRMTVFPAAQPNGSAMLLIPGGGFAWNYFEHEGHYIADILNRAGITCFVLFYRLAQDGWRDPASVGPADAQRAMRVIRANAGRFHLDPARLGVLGFSAGGFLTSTLATRHSAPLYAPVDATDQLSARPLLAAPIYPVQSVDPAYAYGGVAPSLFGGPPTPAQIREWSPDLNVTPAAVPTFLVHAEDDGTVPVANTARLRDAMVAGGITVETHLFAHGGHGFSVGARPGSPDGLWLPLFLNFAREQKLF
ncbi:prolyl oligopeptidase family serine peptidase [Sphingomonas sp. LB-2]|uniref:alpha/beta hydrolase n=1 Tax=Sphingomonas caeni TaxID=2984949 RepID=UPI0022307117|nr:prolyl oligopeptidase family serine peptidase [Sphingomonas caeni]MCW3849529.1 prolyl oligopeptidase family serine peptidase [Sphingomonas caeni]